MSYFSNCATQDEIKNEYRRLAKIHHPDKGGDLRTMQDINSQFKAAMSGERGFNHVAGDDIFIKIIEDLQKLDIEIESCGSWLWISGNTYDNRVALKNAGCKWASAKKLWYWHSEEDSKKGGKTMDMNKIREKHGSKILKSGRVKLGA